MDDEKLTRMMFSEKQRRTVATGVTLVCIAIIIAFSVLCFRGLIWFGSTFAGVFLPLAVGALLAVLLKPYQIFLCDRLKIRPLVAVVMVFLSFIIPLGIFVFMFGSLLLGQLAELFARLPEWYAAIVEWVQFDVLAQTGKSEDPATRERVAHLIQENWGVLSAGGQRLLSEAIRVGIGVFGWLIGLFGWFIVPVYLGFFLLSPTYDVGRLEAHLPFLKPSTRKDAIYLCREFLDILVAFFRGQILVALAQGILYAIGFSIIGLDYGFVIGLLLGFLNIVPYLGNIIGLAVALPISYFQTGGGPMLLGLVLAVFAVVQVLEGTVLTPRIMGKRTGLHPLAIIVAMFFWGTALNGIAGMILAVPLTAFFVVFWRLAKRKYIKEWV